MENDTYTKAFHDIANSASKLHTLCQLTIDYTETQGKNMHTMLYIIKDYVEDIKQKADTIINNTN